MNHDEFMNEVKHMFGVARADGYKAGFSDGMKFVTEPANELTSAFDKAKIHALAQIDDLYGQGKEYWVAVQAINAIFNDLMNAAHLQEPSKIEDFWDDEYGDDL